MPEARYNALVTNTTPLIALAAATDSLDILRTLYQRVIVQLEVAQELEAGGKDGLGLRAFAEATWLERRTQALTIAPYLRNSLDHGEAAVIQTALDEGVELVCIDEAVGRRIARLSSLTLTGSVGILLKAHQNGYPISIPDAINRMRESGIWLGEQVVRFALEQSKQTES